MPDYSTDLGRLFNERVLDGLRDLEQIDLTKVEDGMLWPLVVVHDGYYALTLTFVQLDNGFHVDLDLFAGAARVHETVPITLRRPA